jgi:hypothetical protein
MILGTTSRDNTSQYFTFAKNFKLVTTFHGCKNFFTKFNKVNFIVPRRYKALN